MEVWKSIEGFEGLYVVSNYGRVWSYYFNKPLKSLVGNSKGYLIVDLRKNKMRYSKTIHSLVMNAFIGCRPLGYVINHKDGVRINNHVTNLEYVTPQQNFDHAVANGRFNHYGERHFCSKLKNSDILEIRKLACYVSRTELAKRYHVKFNTITNIIQRKTWKLVEMEVVNAS